MSNYVNDLNDLITAKSEIKNIIQDTLNENPSEVFSYYPSYIARIAASSEGPYVVSYSYLSENYPDFTYLYAYVADAVESGGGSVDLSSYVTYAYLASKNYVDYNAFNGLENEVYLDEDDGGSGTFKASLKDVLEESGLIYEADTNVFDVMDIQSTIDSTVEEYLTNSSYVTASDLPVINESLIPKESNTYTLGDADHIYSASYTKSTYFTNNTKIVGSSSDITFYTGGLSRVKINNNILRPDRTGVDLGTSSQPWANTYTENLYAPTLNLSSDGKHSIKINGNDIRFAYNDIGFYLNNNGFRPGVNGTKTLGTYSAKWGATYTSNIYANNAYISSSTYLPVNTYWYDGSTYHWLGDLFN